MGQEKIILYFNSDVDGIPGMDYIEFEMTDHKKLWIHAEKTWFIESKKNLDTTYDFCYKIGFNPEPLDRIRKYGDAKGFINSIQKVCHMHIVDQDGIKEYSDASLIKMTFFDHDGSATGVFI